jgi:hypothetical protein
MASYHNSYPIGSISSGTMREDQLIPIFMCKLDDQLRSRHVKISQADRKRLTVLYRDIDKRSAAEDYYDTDDASDDLNDLFDALNIFAGPYFYFGAHPGNGADYGYWLSESWDEDFQNHYTGNDAPLKVNDISEIPRAFRGHVAVVNDHGNVTLYDKTSRSLREIWSIV